MWTLEDVASIAFYAFFGGFWLVLGGLLAILFVAMIFNLFDDEIII